jgi:hypothetical protein
MSWRQAGLDRVCKPDDVLITAGAAEANYLAHAPACSRPATTW